jgi:microcystin-dependent protein
LPLESAVFISDLTTTNPAHADGLSQADSHMRLIKSTVKATFPNFISGALQSTQAQLDAAVGATTGTVALGWAPGTVALPGLTCALDKTTGWSRPAADQVAYSIAGVQALLMGGSAIVTSLGIAAPAVASAGAFSGGTGQLAPIGSTLIWWDDVLPVEGGYAWANGQIIASANTVCPILLARWGSRFGGNGTTTMGLPDLRASVPMGRPTMGGVAIRALSISDQAMNTLIGAANVVLAAINIPPINSAGAAAVNTNISNVLFGGSVQQFSNFSQGGGATFTAFNAANTPSQATIPSTGTSNVSSTNTGNTPVSLIQPSTVCNYIIRLA